MVKKVGPYELKSILGKGMFGTVYLGRHTPSNNKIAVKVISKETLKPELQIRLEQEILCQRSVSSENIVKLIDVQKTENNFYLVLEYCEGGDLGNFIKQNGPVTEKIAQKWMQQITEGFKVLQKKNIIHRDLKLQNILMTENTTSAVLKLADFGLSRFLEDDLATTWVGTPLYMAPEVLKCEEYGSKADIWSLGLVLYEILTGELPIKVQKREQIPSAQKSLKSLPEFLSDDCKDLLSKLLEYDSHKRISFEEIFIHPFIRPDESKPNNLKDSEEEDFILLDRDESVHEGIVFVKDTHPIANIPESISSVKLSLQVSLGLENIAEKCAHNKDFFTSLAVFIEASSILESKIRFCKDLVEKYNLNPIDFPKLFEKYNELKQTFEKILKRTAEIEKLVDDDDMSEILIQEYLFKQAINLSSQAAKYEYLNDYNNSKNKYQEAWTLFDYLSKSYGCELGENKIFVDSFISKTYRRLDNVIIKLNLS